MRTRWLVLLVLVAACQTSGGGRSGAIVWYAPARTPVLERKDAGENATPQQGQVRITVGDAVRESLAANRTVRQARLAAAIALATEREARAGLLPSLILTGVYSRRDSPPTVVAPQVTVNTRPREGASYALNLGFPIFAFGKDIHADSAARFARRGAAAE